MGQEFKHRSPWVSKNKCHCIQYLPGPAWRDPLLAPWKEPPGSHCHRVHNLQPQYCGQAAGHLSQKAHPLWSMENKNKYMVCYCAWREPFTRQCTSELLKWGKEAILRVGKLFKNPAAFTPFTWINLLLHISASKHLQPLSRKEKLRFALPS